MSAEDPETLGDVTRVMAGVMPAIALIQAAPAWARVGAAAGIAASVNAEEFDDPLQEDQREFLRLARVICERGGRAMDALREGEERKN